MSSIARRAGCGSVAMPMSKLLDLPAIAAPEICVEVLSPSNKRGEIEEKRRLYFEAGAREVWICERSGQIRFFLKAAPAKDAGRSALCPDMPVKI